MDLDKSRIDNVKQNFIRTPQLGDAGDSFRDFGVNQNDALRHMSGEESDEFDQALEDSNHEKTDQMFLKAIRKDPKLFQNFKENAEDVEAFNQALQDRLDKTEQVHRFISVDELDNYLETGEFQSTKNDFVSFTVEKKSVFFGERAVTVSVNAEEIKKSMKPLKYTAFPRNERQERETITSEKNQGFALEVEARLPTNTKIPANLQISINEFVPASEVEAIKQKYSKLGSVTFKNIQRDL